MDDLFASAGTLHAAYQRVDWSSTALGPVASWTPTLRTVLDVAFRTRFPVTLLWGPEFVLLYNEAYVELIGDKHPASLGAPAAEVFPEIWDTIGPMLVAVNATGQANLAQDLRLLMDRHGFLEECFFTFSYSAVRNAAGEAEGIIDIAAETTAQMLSQRRLTLLAALTDQLAGLDHPGEIADRALRVLRDHPLDFSEVEVVFSGGDELVVDSVAFLPLAPRGPVLRGRLNPYLMVDEECRRFLRLIGAALTQAFGRAQARQTEQRLTAMERDLSETLQRSLLTEPARPDHLQVAVRYQPAAEQARVGGDWYDAFLLPDGRLAIAVGDVTGHDHHATAAMAQVRNLLRGIAYMIEKPPAEILRGLNTAMLGLDVDGLATAVLARIEPGGRHRTLRWSNAGHPPPMLLRPDGSVTVLHTMPEMLLGARATASRTDHTVELPPGAALVLYTDGLIERRGRSIDDGLEDLVKTLTDRQELSAEQLSDQLVARYAAAAEDDIVIVVVRTPA